jgi:hypothetical protein
MVATAKLLPMPGALDTHGQARGILPFGLIKENRSLFRKFALRPPYKSRKNIFCLRADRMVNSYRKVSINKLELRVPKAPLHERIQLRIVPR